MADRMKYRALCPELCVDDALNELFLNTWDKSEVEQIEEIERTGKIELEDV